MTRRLSELARDAGLPPPDRDVDVTGIAEDSRLVAPGFVFVAHVGVHADGHAYIPAAIERGAAAIVSERPADVGVPAWVVADGRRTLARLAAAFHGHPTRELAAIGVTGTNGKTSVCHFIAHLLGADETAVLGTVANFARGVRALTTPASPAVQAFAREAVDAGARFLVLEASSAGLEQARLAEVSFRVGVFTNLTRDHLDLHGTMDAYGAAKSLLFRALPGDGRAILNADDPFSEALRAVTPAPVWTYGLEPGADLVATLRGEDRLGLRVEIAWRGWSIPVALPLHGRHGALNALAALGAALALGRDVEDAAARLESLPPVLGRWQAFERGDGVDAIVDYAHTPDGLEQVLGAVARLYPSVVVVFGCAGGSDRGKRSQMGEIAGRHARHVVLTADNPKDEDPAAIADEIARGVARTAASCERVLDRVEAIAAAVARAQPGGAVLVAGKGHETYQIVRGAFVPHSDVAALEGLGFRPVPLRRA